ncbi:MAG: GLUG motif-containing protein [Planctomycetota bacterium]|jgi:hypothetical protein
MTIARIKRISGAITFLITIFSLSLPAYAKYSGGTGEPNDPYQIATAEDLMLLGETPEDYDKHFILTADIDLDPNLPGRKAFDRAVIAPDMNDVEKRFQGIMFNGVFDGNDHIISNLTISGMNNLGLFGFTDGSTISDIGLEAIDVNGTGTAVGGLVGENFGNITTSHTSGKVRGDLWVGGLVGSNKGSISDCCSASYVNGINLVGGLVGEHYAGGILSDCYSTGDVNGVDNVGGIVGVNGWGHPDAIISNCYSTGDVKGVSKLGGLVGSNGHRGAMGGPRSNGYIYNSYSTGAVEGISSVGGLIGDSGAGSASNCYSAGDVRGDSSVGGLIGRALGGNVSKCYSSGQVSGSERCGGLVGEIILFPVGSIEKSFWDIQTSGEPNMCGYQLNERGVGCDNSYGKTTAEMQAASTFLEAGWDFVGETANGPNDIWKITEGLDYPRLWWEKYGGGTGDPNNPYLIYTAEHLNELGAERDDYNKHFKLMTDIDFSGYLYDRAVIAPDMIDSGLQHEGMPFTGVLDGNGHAISNLTIEGNSFLGLFGYLDSDAIVSNLSIEAADVNGISDFVGSLAGFIYGNIVECCCTGNVSGNDDVGGLVGSNTIGGNITNCYSTVTVNGNEKVGGLVGYTKGSVTMCYSTGMVISEGQNAGGLVGERNPSYGIVTDCFWDSQTSGQATSAGGTGKTTAEMQTTITFLEAGWDFVDETANGTEDIWWILEGQDYPRLWWEASN